MITIIICILLGIGIRLKKEWYLEDGIAGFLIESFLGLPLGGVLGLAIALALPMETEINIYENNIESLQDNTGISGSFFLGSGSFEGEMRYVFYYQVDGGFKMKQVRSKDALIKYSEEKKVLRYKEEATDSWVNLFALDIFTSNKYEILVPHGTIKNNFNLDAK